MDGSLTKENTVFPVPDTTSVSSIFLLICGFDICQANCTVALTGQVRRASYCIASTWLLAVYVVMISPLPAWLQSYRFNILIEAVHISPSSFHKGWACDSILDYGVATCIKFLGLIWPIVAISIFHFDEPSYTVNYEV